MPDLSLFDLAERRLAWLDQRQSVLSQNIANADTPHYRARDLRPFADQLAVAQAAGRPVRTNPLHMTGLKDDSASAEGRSGEHAIDGNAVQLDTELSKVADTDTNQELVSDLFRKYANLYRIALGR